MSAYDDESEERQKIAKDCFQYTKEAIKLIQERTKISVDYILKLSRRATKDGIKLVLGKQKEVDDSLKGYGVEFEDED